VFSARLRGDSTENQPDVKGRIVAAYDAIVSLLILKIIDRSLGLRVSRDVEIEGLDLTLHGEAVQ
jgi:ammonia channel protein AmtB